MLSLLILLHLINSNKITLICFLIALISWIVTFNYSCYIIVLNYKWNDTIIPTRAYNAIYRLYKFMESSYLDNASTEIGINKLFHVAKFYQYKINYFTST